MQLSPSQLKYIGPRFAGHNLSLCKFQALYFKKASEILIRDKITSEQSGQVIEAYGVGSLSRNSLCKRFL